MLRTLRHWRWLIYWLSFGVGAASQPPFWLMEKGPQQMWLLGSIHVGREGFYPLPPAVVDALAQAEQLILEVDLNSTGIDEIRSLERRARLAADEQLQQLLLPEGYQAVQQAARQLNLPLTQLQRYHPWFVALLVEQALYQQQGLNPEEGIDQFFMQQAGQRNMPIMGLETFDEQVELLASLEPYEAAFLEMTLGEIAQLQQQFKLMVNSWQQGDLETLAQLLSPFDDSAEGRAIAELLLYQRNHRWTERLNRPDSYRKRLVVVGAMHLLGPQGLVQLLTQRGWQPTRLH